MGYSSFRHRCGENGLLVFRVKIVCERDLRGFYLTPNILFRNGIFMQAYNETAHHITFPAMTNIERNDALSVASLAHTTTIFRPNSSASTFAAAIVRIRLQGAVQNRHGLFGEYAVKAVKDKTKFTLHISK